MFLLSTNVSIRNFVSSGLVFFIFLMPQSWNLIQNRHPMQFSLWRTQVKLRHSRNFYLKGLKKKSEIWASPFLMHIPYKGKVEVWGIQQDTPRNLSKTFIKITIKHKFFTTSRTSLSIIFGKISPPSNHEFCTRVHLYALLNKKSYEKPSASRLPNDIWSHFEKDNRKHLFGMVQ